MSKVVIYIINPLFWIWLVGICAPYLPVYVLSGIIVLGLITFYFYGIKPLFLRIQKQPGASSPADDPTAALRFDGQTIDNPWIGKDAEYVMMRRKQETKRMFRGFARVGVCFVGIFFIQHTQDQLGWGEGWTPLEITYVLCGVVAAINVVNEIIRWRKNPLPTRDQFYGGAR